jgi:hypothetical protein
MGHLQVRLQRVVNAHALRQHQPYVVKAFAFLVLPSGGVLVIQEHTV